MNDINKEYLESLSTENAACFMREKRKQSNEDSISISDNVALSIEYALKNNKENTNVIY